MEQFKKLVTRLPKTKMQCYEWANFIVDNFDIKNSF